MDVPSAQLPALRDINFHCQECSGPLVVDAAAAGMTLACPHCHSQITVPRVSGNSSEEAIETERKLKENESQRTEVTSYINQLCIQVHRWKLRLQTLNERKAELEATLSALKAPQ